MSARAVAARARPVLALSASAFPQEKDKPSAPPPEVSAAAIDAAITNGLVWLCQHQDTDGGWRTKSVVTHCDGGTPCAANVPTARCSMPG